MDSLPSLRVFAALASTCAAALLAPSPAIGTTVTFATPGSYDWVVPPGIDSATFGVFGARGGASASTAGGAGGGVQGTLELIPGETLRIRVGGAGADAPATVGGQNGGGLAGSQTCVTVPFCNGGGGGGASDVRRGGATLFDRVLVGGAGGGAGGRSTDGCSDSVCASPHAGGAGGAGGSLAAEAGLWGGGGTTAPSGGGCGGGGGDQSQGGAMGSSGGGALSCNGPTGNESSGSLGLGGNGGDSAGGGGSGGGGGGGWYGGGGGAGGLGGCSGCSSGGGGGGGGSNYAAPAASGVVMSQGTNTGDGLVTITYGEAPGTPQITGSNPPSPADDNNPELLGTTDLGTTVALFTTSDCSGPAVASGTGASFTSAGITVSVPDDSTTTFHATATAGGSASACSGPFTYVERTPGGGPPDLVAPRIALAGPRAQRLGRFVKIKATAGSEACTVVAVGRAKIPGKDPKLSRASIAIAPGGTGSLRLAVSKKARRAIAAAFADGARPVAAVVVVGRDAAGNETSLRRRIRLER